MWADRVRKVFRRDDGFAMVTAMVVSSVMMLFTIGLMATGLHLETATVRDRSWNVALQVAEAGIDRAMYAVSQDPMYAGTAGGVIALPGGEAEILVTQPTPGEIIVYSTGYAPSRAATNAVKRRIQAAYAPQDVFSYALFSETGLYVKNNSITIGDIFANEGILVDNNAQVYGSVISATEGVQVSSNAVLYATDGEGGDVYSGGPAGITLDSNAVVQGSAFAQATSCSGSPGAGEYGVTSSGTVQGDATAWGTISGNVLGVRTPGNCQLAQSTRYLPSFTWDASLYSDEVEYTTVAAFQAFVDANLNNMTGVHHLYADECASDPSGHDPVQLGGITISDDFTFVTNCRIDMDNNVTVTASSDALITIVVENLSTDPPAVLIKNNFDVLNDPAVLLYATGLIEVKNNPSHNGAVYAGAISIKNNLDVTYDSRVERTLGFGDLKYDRVSWIECRAGSTGTDC